MRLSDLAYRSPPSLIMHVYAAHPQDTITPVQALKDMDTETLRKILGDVNLPSWINFPGMPVHLLCPRALPTCSFGCCLARVMLPCSWNQLSCVTVCTAYT